ncbi:MAG: hypothetical protein R3F56_05500 [Planctomycetota bacterium]
MEALGLVVALVAFLWASDLQGVILHRNEFQVARQWLAPGLVYVFAAGIALWKWDWLLRVALSLRFATVAALVVAAIWWASSQSEAKRPAGVALLHEGERDRLPVLDQELPAPRAAAWVLPDPERFQPREPVGHGAGEQQGAGQGSGGFEYDLPKGWTEQPATNMRPVNLRVAGDPRAECYLASLPGAAGGVLDNINRWRKQMGVGPIDDAALAKLPRAKLLGRDAVVAEVDGTFTGMGGAALENARMVGAVAALPAVTLFLKMVGPKDVVEKERAAFDKLLASVRMPGMGKPRDGASRPQASVEPPPADAGSGLRWAPPEGWSVGADRPMRLVTLMPKGAQGVECYVTVLPGAAGGVLDNVNRWRGQFSLAPQTQAQVDALPTVQVLGREAPIVALSGTFTGMGTEGKQDHGLLGTIAVFGDSTVFVKMTGPKEQVQAERERFLEFCRSIKEQ